MTHAKNSAPLAPGVRLSGRSRCGGFLIALLALMWLPGCGAHPNASSGPNGFAMLASTQSENTTGEQAAPVLVRLKLSETSVVGGASTTATMTLAQPAPNGGVRILLTSSEPAAVHAPSSVEFGEGQDSFSFPVATSAVTAAVSVTVRAQYQGSTAGASLSVLPAATAPFTVTVAPATVTVQQGKTGSSKVTTKVATGFDDSLQLKASGEPSGVSLTLNPEVIPAPGSGTSALSISVASSVQTGSYPFTITASHGTASAAAKATLKVISGSTNPDATFKGCWYKQGSRRYQAVDVSVGKPGTYPFNAILYYGATCNANDFADQFGFGELLNFGGFGYIFWFTAFADQTDMSALWYVGDENSQCVNYAVAPDC
jgi:hypothetical protein